jgi:N utilization substance protein B
VGIRREGREHALQALYSVELHPDSPREAIRLFMEAHPCKKGVKDFALGLLPGLLDNQAVIDARIAEKSPNWSISRMSKIDLCIIRLATYELLFREDIPRNVTINEAIEIAKKFGSEESPAFVNGILDEIARGLPQKPAAQADDAGKIDSGE